MADFENTTQKFGEQAKALPMGTMVRDIAMGISDAQSQMDKGTVALMIEYGKRNIDLNGDGSKQVSLLELGFAPQFLFFQKVSIKLHMDLRFHAEEATSNKLGVGGGLGVSGGSSSTTNETAEQRQTRKTTAQNTWIEDDKKAHPTDYPEPATPEAKTAKEQRLKAWQDEWEKANPAQGGAKTSDVKGSLAVAAAYDTSEARKFSLDASMATEVIAELVSVPAPAKLTELIAARFAQEKAAELTS